MDIKKITAKPPVFEAVQQKFHNVTEIKRWLDAESVSISSEVSVNDNPIVEITYHVRRDNQTDTFSLKIYDVSDVDEFCGNDWIISFGDGHFETRPHGLFRQLYDIQRPLHNAFAQGS